jgi:hypothetical protein
MQRKECGKMKKTIGIILVMMLLANLSSCIAIGAGGEKVHNHPTIGQQLIDLQKARDDGAITQPEYEELKEKLKNSPVLSATEASASE